MNGNTPAQYREGQTASGPNGAKLVFRGGAWLPFSGAATPAMPSAPSGGAVPLSQFLGSSPSATSARAGADPDEDTPTAPPSPIAQAYQKYFAKPATAEVAHGLSDLPQTLKQMADPAQYAISVLQPKTSPGQQPIAPWAQTGAEMVVPQTPTAAALDVASLALPEVGAAEVLGESAGPLRRALGTRLGRVAGGAAVGAGAGALTGEGAGQGALEGFGAFAPAEALGYGVSKALAGPAERIQQRLDAKAIGKAISDTIPWVGKLEKPGDFENAFMKGEDSGVIQAASQRLADAKRTVFQTIKGKRFLVPTPDGMDIKSFPEADKLATDLQKGYGYGLNQQMRGGWTARDARALAFQIREHLANGLNLIKSGLGDTYRAAGRNFDAARTLTMMLGPEGLMTPSGISQPEMLSRLRGMKNGRLMYDLDRSMGRGTRDRLMSVLGRGYAGISKDIPSKPASHNWMGHHVGRIMGAGVGSAVGGALGGQMGHPALGAELGGIAGLMIPGGGESYKPIGKVNPLVRFTGAPFEIGLSNLMGEQLKPVEVHESPGMDSLDQSRAEAVAPTPSASTRAMKVSKDLAKGKQPDVHRDLARGRLSEPEIEKLLQYANSSDPSSIVQGMPIEEVLNAAEVADPSERKMLMPMIMQRLKAELPKMQNKTIQANLASRFQKLMVSTNNVDNATNI